MTGGHLEKKDILYKETITSDLTEALFLVLTGAFGFAAFWNQRVQKTKRISVFTFLSGIFLFYSLNYRLLNILIDHSSIRLTFGIFSWQIPIDNIKTCELDELPPVLKYGGAGIHFFLHRNRYRASINFLEHPRLVISLKQKYGPIEEMSFSTRHPEEILSLLKSTITTSQ